MSESTPEAPSSVSLDVNALSEILAKKAPGWTRDECLSMISALRAERARFISDELAQKPKTRSALTAASKKVNLTKEDQANELGSMLDGLGGEA